MNTINCRLGKRNCETAIAIPSSDNDQARPYYGTPDKLWRILADGPAVVPIDMLAASMQGRDSQNRESGLYTRNCSRNRE